MRGGDGEVQLFVWRNREWLGGVGFVMERVCEYIRHAGWVGTAAGRLRGRIGMKEVKFMAAF